MTSTSLGVVVVGLSVPVAVVAAVGSLAVAVGGGAAIAAHRWGEVSVAGVSAMAAEIGKQTLKSVKRCATAVGEGR